MSQCYTRVYEALQVLKNHHEGAKPETYENAQARAAAEEKEAEEDEARRARQAAESAEAKNRMMSQEGPPLPAVYDNDTLACILEVGSLETTHRTQTNGPVQYRYVSHRSQEGENGERAPTYGQMRDLEGPLITDTDSAFRIKVGTSINKAVSQWRRYCDFLVSWISYAGLSHGGRVTWWNCQADRNGVDGRSRSLARWDRLEVRESALA